MRRESHLEQTRCGDDADVSLAVLMTATAGERLRAIIAATSTIVSSAFTVVNTGQVGLGSTARTDFPPSLSAIRSAIDSFSTPASDGSSWT